jgi:hypothetical protein
MLISLFFLSLSLSGAIEADGIAQDNSSKKEIFWMHIEKTSSWIGSLILVWACPKFCRLDLQSLDIHEHRAYANRSEIGRYNYLEHFENSFNPESVSKLNMLNLSDMMMCSFAINSYTVGFGFHMPYSNPRMKDTIITMFRNPYSRVVSSYLFGMMLPSGLKVIPPLKTYSEVRESIENSSNPFLAYANYPGIASCQTKMMLGYLCGMNIQLKPGDLKKAVERLQDLYFFGITEEPLASANLFLAMRHMDSERPDIRNIKQLVDPPFIFTHTRKNIKHSSEMHMQLLNNLYTNKWRDEFDDELYRQAKRIFYDRCKEYKISLLKQTF